MTGENVPISTGFAIITVSQLAVGIIFMVFAVKRGGDVNSVYQRAALIQGA